MHKFSDYFEIEHFQVCLDNRLCVGCQRALFQWRESGSALLEDKLGGRKPQ